LKSDDIARLKNVSNKELTNCATKGMKVTAANRLTASGRKQKGLETVVEQLGEARRLESGSRSMLNESETLEEL
jgi:hypothetical protein